MRLEYSRLMALQNFGGAPNFLRIAKMSAWLEVSNAFTRSAKTT